VATISPQRSLEVELCDAGDTMVVGNAMSLQVWERWLLLVVDVIMPVH
jgi:hypothetical protein